jgi:hypothetical protein
MATPPVFTTGAVLTAAQMNGIGLWITASTVLNGQTTASVSNCFNSDFENYMLVWNVRGAAGALSAFGYQLALNGTPNTTAGSYISAGRFVGYPGVGAADYNGAGTSWGGSFFTSFPNNGSVTISQPFGAIQTAMTGTYISNNAAVWVGGYHNQTASYNGLYFFNGSATAMYGRISVYGMRQ